MGAQLKILPSKLMILAPIERAIGAKNHAWACRLMECSLMLSPRHQSCELIFSFSCTCSRTTLPVFALLAIAQFDNEFFSEFFWIG